MNPPIHVQRLSMRSMDPRLPFAERFQFDDMRSAGYGKQKIEACLRRLHESRGIGTVSPDGVQMFALWDDRTVSESSILKHIVGIYEGSVLTRHYIAFDRPSRRRPRNERQFDSWLDLDNAVFWTWRNCNLHEVRQNIAVTLETLTTTP